MLAETPSWAIKSFFVYPMVIQAATACLYQPAGPLRSGTSALTCPLPIHDGAGISFAEGHRPWTYPPRCLRSERSRTENEKKTEALYCLYTYSTFHDDHGTSIITTPEIAASLIGDNALSDRPVSPDFRQPVEPNAYEIVDIPRKGKGLVATRKIKKGEIFMIEYPALLLGVSFLEDVKAHHRRRIVRRAVEQLPEGTRKKIYRLYRKEGGYLLDDILSPNAVSVPVTEDEAHMGLFLDFSRINHNCLPNALYRFSPKTLALEVYSYRTILPGEEITVSYTPLHMPRDRRHEYLKENWGIDCTCPLCLSTDEQEISDSDHRRQRVGELKRAVLEASSEQYFENALVMAHEWLSVGEQEGIPPLLAEYYDIVARLSFDVGDLQAAKRLAQLAFDSWTKFGSMDDTDLEAAREYVRELNRLGRDVTLEKKGIPNMFKDRV